MKLYTEEQVFKAIQIADKYHYLITSEECDIVNSLTPIELPSDEEIEKEAKSNCEYNQDSLRQFDSKFIDTFTDGAKWLRDKLQGGNNEQL